jgi:hypothetical protein
MSKQTVKFFGSDADLRDLREALSKAGFKEDNKDIIYASHDLIHPSITFIMVGLPFVRFLLDFLRDHKKRLEGVPEGKKKTVIRGFFSVKKALGILKITYGFSIEDDTNNDKNKT